MNKALKLAGYVFLLGLASYAWWKITAHVKRQIDAIEREEKARA